MTTTHRVHRAGAAIAAACLALGAVACGSGTSGGQALPPDARALTSVAGNANSIGSAKAPYTLTLYAPPTSVTLSTVVLPQLSGVVDRYVREGALRVQARTLGGSPYANGADALQASRLIQAAGLQGRFWPALLKFSSQYDGAFAVVDQGGVLRDAGVGNVAAAMRARGDARVTKAIRRANTLAANDGSRGFRDLYVVSNARGVRIDVTNAAAHDRLVAGVADAMKLIKG